MEQIESPLISVSEASRRILLQKPVTVYDKIARGIFGDTGVVVRIGPRCIRFHKQKLLAWLENGGTVGNGDQSQVA